MEHLWTTYFEREIKVCLPSHLVVTPLVLWVEGLFSHFVVTPLVDLWLALCLVWSWVDLYLVVLEPPFECGTLALCYDIVTFIYVFNFGNPLKRMTS